MSSRMSAILKTETFIDLDRSKSISPRSVNIINVTVSKMINGEKLSVSEYVDLQNAQFEDLEVKVNESKILLDKAIEDKNRLHNLGDVEKRLSLSNKDEVLKELVDMQENLKNEYNRLLGIMNAKIWRQNYNWRRTMLKIFTAICTLMTAVAEDTKSTGDVGGHQQELSNYSSDVFSLRRKVMLEGADGMQENIDDAISALRCAVDDWIAYGRTLKGTADGFMQRNEEMKKTLDVLKIQAKSEREQTAVIKKDLDAINQENENVKIDLELARERYLALIEEKVNSGELRKAPVGRAYSRHLKKLLQAGQNRNLQRPLKKKKKNIKQLAKASRAIAKMRLSLGPQFRVEDIQEFRRQQAIASTDEEARRLPDSELDIEEQNFPTNTPSNTEVKMNTESGGTNADGDLYDKELAKLE